MGSAIGYGERAAVVQGHLRLMEQFLRTQEAVMRLFLAGEAPQTAAPQPIPVVSVAQPLAAPVVPVKTNGNGNGYHHTPVSPVPLPPAPVAPAPVAAPPVTPPVTPLPVVTPNAAQAPASTPDPRDPARLKSLLLGLVSAKTGYPVEMLDLNANLEADLGIDSIKRVEILGAFNRETKLLDAKDIEQVSSLKSLGAMLAFFQTSSLKT